MRDFESINAVEGWWDTDAAACPMRQEGLQKSGVSRFLGAYQHLCQRQWELCHPQAPSPLQTTIHQGNRMCCTSLLACQSTAVMNLSVLTMMPGKKDLSKATHIASTGI